MKSILSILAACSILSACATAPSGNTASSKTRPDGNDILASILSSDVDTSKTHAAGPILCPDKIAGVSFNRILNFNPKANNISCIYEGDSRYYTLYAYDQVGVPLGVELNGVVDAVLTSKKDFQMVYNKEVSKTCALSGLIFAIDLGDGAKGSNITINPNEPIGDTDGYDYAVGVMTGDDVLSIAAVHSRDNIFFKIRTTVLNKDGFTEAEVFEECSQTAKLMRVLDTSFDASKLISAQIPKSNI